MVAQNGHYQNRTEQNFIWYKQSQAILRWHNEAKHTYVTNSESYLIYNVQSVILESCMLEIYYKLREHIKRKFDRKVEGDVGGGGSV